MCQFRNEGKSEFRNERKRARSRYDWPGFYFCSVEKVARGFLTNHRANPIENRSVDTMFVLIGRIVFSSAVALLTSVPRTFLTDVLRIPEFPVPSISLSDRNGLELEVETFIV